MSTLQERFANLYCGVVYDAMHFDVKYTRPFVLHASIKPVWDMNKYGCNSVLFGPAFTVKGHSVLQLEDVQDTIRITMLEKFTPGCVQVMAIDGDSSAAHYGDISGRLAKKFGAVGAVFDGYTRDARLLERDRFPVFCRGVQPISAHEKWQITEIMTEVYLDGQQGKVCIRPGDWIFGDSDGVLAVPRELGEEVCILAEERLENENIIRQRLNDSSIEELLKLKEEVVLW